MPRLLAHGLLTAPPMSWVLLAFGSLLALAVANALRARPRSLGLPRFIIAWLVTELSLHVLVLGGIAVAGLAAFGGLRGWPGWLGLTLALAAGGGLVALSRRARRDAGALRERAAEAAPAAPEIDRRYPQSHLVFPWRAFHRRDIVVERGVPFTSVGGPTLRLDIYRPKLPGTRRPAVLQVHGGAWVFGFKRYQGIPLLTHLASNGWVGFNIDYRLSPAATFPEHLIDVKRALAWVREHAEQLGVDPDFIVITGGSAGGHLAALAGLTAGDPEYQPGFETADTSVSAVVVFYGVFDLANPRYRGLVERLVMKAKYNDTPARFLQASPTERVTADAPAFVVVHGAQDTVAPVEDARRFVERLRAVSRRPVLYLEVGGAEHEFDMLPSVRNLPVIETVAAFLTSLHAAHAAPG